MGPSHYTATTHFGSFQQICLSAERSAVHRRYNPSMYVPRNSWLLAPFVLGAAPLTVGLSIFLFWLVTGWMWLQFAGLLTLYAGFGLVVVGLVWSVIWTLKMIFSGNWSRERLTQMIFVAVILVINFPVAWGIIWTAIHLENRHLVYPSVTMPLLRYGRPR
jgi:hypothetical protein